MKKIILLFALKLGLIYPELGIKNDKQYFSPNLDGIKDIIEIPFKIKEDNLIEWRVLILKETAPRKFKKIRSIQSENPKKQSLNFQKFFKRLFAKDKAITDPSLVSWDGKDEKYTSLSDGVYYLKIFAEDKFGNKEESDFIPIILDTKSPGVSIKLAENIFSPNEDGRKDELLIDINISDFGEFDKWNLTFLDKNDKEVFSLEGDENRLFKWPGVDNNGKPLKEGNYKIKVFAYDLAGNESDVIEDSVNLVTSFEKAKLSGSENVFSPNEDGYFDSIELQSQLSSAVGLNSWSLDLFNEDNQKVAVLNEDGSFIEKVIFNGLDGEEKVLKDGVYTARATAEYDSGNLIQSNPIKIKLDNTPPALKVNLENKVFNPLSKNRGDKAIRITQNARGEKSDTYRAIIKNQNGEIVFTKDFGSRLPSKFSWDGSNDNQEKIGGEYVYTLIGEDKVANISVLETAPFNLVTEDLNVDFQAVNPSFSPNNDNRLDIVNFVLEVNETYRELFQKGEIRFLNDKRNLVKRIPVERIKKKLAVGWQKNANNKTPSRWQILFIPSKPAFQLRKKWTLPLKQLYLDTTPVDLGFKVEETIFSPNGDGNLDTIEIENVLIPSQLKKRAGRV